MFITVTRRHLLAGLAFLFLCAAGLAVYLGRPPEHITAAALRPSAYTPILDAGHGGPDGGAVSPAGYYESHINLAIARKAELLFRLFGYAPVMTRREDISIHDSDAATIREKKVSDLKNRVKLANSVENGLLISIHQNIFSQSRYSGAQCFYTARAESESLADAVQRCIAVHLDPGNKREIKQAPEGVYLLAHVTCPAVLIECGFLSNAGDEGKLIQSGYQTQMAACIVTSFILWDSEQQRA